MPALRGSKKIKEEDIETPQAIRSTWIDAYQRRPEAIAIQKESKQGNTDTFDDALHEWYTRGEWIANKDEMAKAVYWKMGVGKTRPNKYKLATSNTIEHVENCLRNSQQFVNKSNNTNFTKKIKPALKEIMKIKFAGPATSTAVLSRYSTDIPYMYDEVLNFVLPGQKIGYTVKEYEDIFERMTLISRALENDIIGITPKTVAETIWAAKRLNIDLKDPRF